jgi:adenosine deaminase
MTENFLATQAGLNLSKDDLYKLSLNAIQAAFINHHRKDSLETELNRYFVSFHEKDAN